MAGEGRDFLKQLNQSSLLPMSCNHIASYDMHHGKEFSYTTSIKVMCHWLEIIAVLKPLNSKKEIMIGQLYCKMKEHRSTAMAIAQIELTANSYLYVLQFSLQPR